MAASKADLVRVYNARPDTLDFRDKMYQASLYEVPVEITLDDFKTWGVPVLDQGQEGACTGFGLATVANYLLRRRKIVSDPSAVSPRMLYEMARRYDEWPGEDYSGSSARGAMKGWHKHGICGEACWPYIGKPKDQRLNEVRSSDALKRPLGAYYRVNHKDLVAMHSAMAEVGILYATAQVHEGWDRVNKNGNIPFMEKVLGGHAFAIVAYNTTGFWIQNSWGSDWGKEGFALITYDDWLSNGSDVWVARLGAPVKLKKVESTSITHSASAGKSEAYSYSDLRPHVISIGNNGQLKAGGNFGTSRAELRAIFEEDFPRITEKWAKKRILLYAHGGLVSEAAAVQRLAEYRNAMLQAEVYPISFIWHSDAWTTITNLLKDTFATKRPEGFLDGTKDFMLDRLDDALEPVARAISGKLQWDEMKENALMATSSATGGARLSAGFIKGLAEQYKDNFEIHIAAHSAGSIFLGPLIQLLTSRGKITSGYLKGSVGKDLPVLTCTLWAPACTIDLFKQFYLPAIKNESLGRFALFILDDDAERNDNCAKIYNKSLLYLVSNAFEKTYRIPLFRPDGEALLGMEKFVKKEAELTNLFDNDKADLVIAPNASAELISQYSTSTTHGDFDDNIPTVRATLARILNAATLNVAFKFDSSASFLKDRRTHLSSLTDGII